MSKRLSVFLVITLVLAVFGVVGTGSAATNTSLSVAVANDTGDCSTSLWNITFEWTGSIDDTGSGGDYAGMIAYDGAGVPLSSDWNSVGIGSVETRVTAFGNGFWINAPTARPFTIVMYDITTQPPYGWNSQDIYDNILAQGAPVLETLVYDPADDISDCESLGVEEAPAAAAAPVPGCDQYLNIPAQATGATILADTPVYWKPGEMSDEVFPADLNLLATGVDASGAYTRVIFGCGYYWVPSAVVGPNVEAPWNGAPLPTGVVD